jgi:CDP-glucose 4,6-dehydratase
VNVLGTAHVLDAARAAGGVRSIVVVTSDKCYAPGPDSHPEDDPLGGDDPYSASKAAAELVAASYRDSYDLPIATGRAGNVIGGGDWGADRLMPDVLAAATDGRPVELRNPQAVRPWQHVLSPLAGYLLLAEAVFDDPASFAAGWNFGPDPGDELPVRALVARIEELWGSPLPVAVQPGEHPPEAATLRLVSDKARERLGWRPAWDLDDGLRAIVAWARAMRAGDDLRALTLSQVERYAAAGDQRLD